MTLEQYIRNNSWPITKTIDHVIRVLIDDDGVRFYVHPQGVDGDTENFVVNGNELSPDPRCVRVS